jgi:hypothetical protein
MLTDQATQPARTRPRHRLRDWPVQVFEYGVTLLHPEPPHRRLATAAELPPAWRAEADRLQGLWNQLCAGFQEFLARRQALLDAQPSAAQAAQAVEEAKQRLQEANAALTQARARRRRTPGEALAPYEAAVQEARARLTAAREARRAARQAVREQLQPALAELRRAYDARLAALRRQVCQAPPDAPFPIYWTHVDDVFTRFLAACKRMAKGGGPPQPDTADPVRLRFLHRWTGGGLPISELALGAA